MKTAAEYAARRDRGSRPARGRTSAEQSWTDGRFPGEQSDAEHRLVSRPRRAARGPRRPRSPGTSGALPATRATPARSPAVRGAGAPAVGTAARGRRGCDRDRRPRGRTRCRSDSAMPQPSTCWVSCPPARPCSRPAPGTGKTFTIAALVARYVAEGVATMDELLVVSFSRESTRELRERVRERLVGARDGLAAHPDDVDRTTRCWRTSRPAEPDELRDGTAGCGWRWPTSTPRPSPRPTASASRCWPPSGRRATTTPARSARRGRRRPGREVADDLYLRKWGVGGAARRCSGVEEFRELALDVAVQRPRPRALVPEPADVGPARHGLRARIAAAVRDEVDRASGGCTCSTTTTCCIGSRHPADRASRATWRRADCASATGGARRRVPGHRPGAVVDPAHPVPRAPDARADRRPEAGHLRLPRRRRPRLPARRVEVGEHGAHAADQLPQRRRAARGLAAAARRCGARATRASGCGRSSAVHTVGWSRVDGAPARRAAAVLPREGRAVPDKPLATQMRGDAVIVPTSPPRSPELGGAARVVPRDGSAHRPLLPATWRCWSARTSRPRR